MNKKILKATKREGHWDTCWDVVVFYKDTGDTITQLYSNYDYNFYLLEEFIENMHTNKKEQLMEMIKKVIELRADAVEQNIFMNLEE